MRENYGAGMGYNEAEAALALGFGMVFFVFMMILVVLNLLAFYKIFRKAGREDAWAAFIPIYSTIVLLDVIKRPWWQFFMYFIPLYGIYLMIVDMNRLSKFFGKSEAFTVGLVFLSPLFLMILAFGPAKYNPNALPDLRD